MKKTITVLVKRPGEAPVLELADNTLECFQELVGGYIETYPFSKNAVVVCNEEGKIEGLPYNCEMFGEIFVGTIVFVGVDGEEFTDFPVSVGNFKNIFKSLYMETADE